MAVRRLQALAGVFLVTVTGAVITARADDPRPVVDDSHAPVQHKANPKLPTLYVVGDSTANSNMPLRGWGSEVGAFFDPAKINVINRAIGGRSSRTFFTEGRWAKVLAELKPGDFVIIQFGHNDAGSYKDPKAKGRPSLKGDGDDTAEALNADGKTTETIHTFGWYMRKYATDAKAKGATPIILSMVPHKDWTDDGKIKRPERATFVAWDAADAKATGALFVDTNEIIAEGLEREGRDKVESFFGDAKTHSTPLGARYNAAAVVVGLKRLKPDPFANDFSKLADDLPASLTAGGPTEPVVH
jgi:lysophospholipase L1-like esterase